MSETAATETQNVVAAGVTDNLARIVDVSAARVYQAPVEVGDRVVIAAASCESAGGFGFGSDNVNNGGGGGGGWGQGRPVAVIEAGPEGVRVRPVLDFTRIGLTAVAAVLTAWKLSRR